MSTTAPTAITGMGAVTPFGLGVERLWQAAVREDTCIEAGLGRIALSTLDEIRSAITVPTSERENSALLITLAAIREAMKSAGWSHLEPTDGLILATTTGQIPMWDRVLVNALAGHGLERFGEFIGNQPLGSLLKKTADYFQFTGRTLLLTSACSAATQALGVAHQWLASKRVKRVLVGGTEVLCALTTQGFSCLQLLSQERCKPFDQARTGINLSEGAAFFCLENKSAQPLARLSGYGLSLDGFHATAPHPEGRGTLKAIQAALRTAGLQPSDISWIHAHGTGSNHNDLAEGAAFAQLDSSATVTSTKAIHGHALGASGAIEGALVVKALQEQTVLRTANLQTPDTKISIRHAPATEKMALRHVLKNTAGFGGNNSAVVFSHG